IKTPAFSAAWEPDENYIVAKPGTFIMWYDPQSFAVLTVFVLERKMLARFLARPLAQQRVFVIRERASLPGADGAHDDQHLIICCILNPGFDTRIPDTKLDEV